MSNLMKKESQDVFNRKDIQTMYIYIYIYIYIFEQAVCQESLPATFKFYLYTNICVCIVNVNGKELKKR